jgi:hypothetical protein
MSIEDTDKPFVEVSEVVWPNEGSVGGNSRKIEAGVHSWPFSLTIPRTARNITRRDTGEYPLPPTFSHKGFPEFIIYELAAKVQKGPLSPDLNLTIPVRYFPRTFTKELHPLLQVAYAAGSELPDPEVCPPGWITNSAKITGRLFSQRDVSLNLNFSIVQPGEYPRGGYIHSYLTIQSDDTQALDLIASKNALDIRLCRRIVLGVDASKMLDASHNILSDLVGRAKLWPAASSSPHPN